MVLGFMLHQSLYQPDNSQEAKAAGDPFGCSNLGHYNVNEAICVSSMHVLGRWVVHTYG